MSELRYTVYDISDPEMRAADGRRARQWKHTADFLNQVANTTIGAGFFAPVATWAFGVEHNPLSSGTLASFVAVLWLMTGIVLHLVAATIVRSLNL